MDITIILISSVLLFLIIYFSVRLAIGPLIHKPDKDSTESNDSGLVKLLDIGVFNSNELEEIIKLYQNKSVRKEDCGQYQKFEKVLNELKEIGYLSDEQYLSKVIKLKAYFNID